jgi:tRNA threonylcarbamoyl adenosine modification protein YeaZ
MLEAMKILFLDIASRDGMIACVTPERVLSVKVADTKISDGDLPRLLEETWNEAGWEAKDITHLACAIGPGGFMSLRVGSATANALAWALDIPVCGIHLSDLYFARYSVPQPALEPPTHDGALWVHSTKKEELFVRGFGMYAAAYPEAMHIIKADLESRLAGQFSFMGELIPEHEQWLQERGGQRAEVHPIADILPGFLAAQAYERKTLQPWYGREG